MTPVLTQHERQVTASVLGEEESRRRHVVVALSGAHAYGFPSPDSDLDLKGIHIEPTRSFLGLGEPRATSDRVDVVEGVEIDYTSNELGVAVRGLVKGNGNYLERILGAHLLVTTPLLEELAPLARGAFSKRYYRHYLGFARQQQREFATSPAPTAKRVLYVLRTALTGTHLLRTGELRVDINENLVEYGYQDARELIARKMTGERTVLDADTATHWRGRVQRAFEMLSKAHAVSMMPEDAGNAAELDRWLVDVRLRR